MSLAVRTKQGAEGDSPGRKTDALDTPPPVVMDLTLPIPPVPSLPGCEGPALRPLLTEPEGVLPAGGGVGVAHVLETQILLSCLNTPRSSSEKNGQPFH